MRSALVGIVALAVVASASGCSRAREARVGPIEPARQISAPGSQQPGQSRPASGPATKTANAGAEQPDLSGIKVAIVIAPKGFRDEEFTEPRKALTEAGAEVTVVSLTKGKCVGAGGTQVEATATPDQIEPDDYDALVFVGGPGMYKFLDNEEFVGLAKRFAKDKNKLIAAICVSPAILANAGLLDGIRATAWKDVHPILAAKGAQVLTDPVVVSGRIITANGPKAAAAYARAIVAALAARAAEKRQ